MDPSSLLFGGTHFNKKKFASDFNKFKSKNVNDDEFKELQKIDTKPVKKNIKSSNKDSNKKKKKKPKLNNSEENSSDFNVFKRPDLERDEAEAEEKDGVLAKKKDFFRREELAISLRKKYGIHVAGENVPAPLQDFEELVTRYGCRSYLLENLNQLGFTDPTPIQRQAIPILLSGRGCLVCAPTGSGKTLAFLIPILMKLKAPSKNGIRAVILCPTRELAAQTTRECKKITSGEKFHVRQMTKSVLRCKDFEKLPTDILVSTPLRLSFALKRNLDLSMVEYLIMDESDKLFEREGLLDQIDPIVAACSCPSVVYSLFSATLPENVEELARTIIHDAVRIIIGKKNAASDLVKQRLVFVGSEEGKLLALRQIFETNMKPPILVFVQSKERAKELHKELTFDDIRVDCIHADLVQCQRERAVERFREGKTWVLIATDVIARGMDFKGVNCVINYDFPETSSTYIHRIGRCGRAGRVGEAITLYTEDDAVFLRNIANIIVSSGGDVPSWILSLPKLKRKKHRPTRDSILTAPRSELKKRRRN